MTNSVIIRIQAISREITLTDSGYDIYSVNGGEIEETDNLMALVDPETDSYTYYNGETEIDEENYVEKFNSEIIAYNSYTGIDHDGMSEMNITTQDGTVDFKELSSQKYMNINEIKDWLSRLAP